MLRKWIQCSNARSCIQYKLGLNRSPHVKTRLNNTGMNIQVFIPDTRYKYNIYIFA